MLTSDLRPSTCNHIVCPRFESPAKLLVEGAIETKDLRDGECRLSVEINGVESIDELVHQRLYPSGIPVIKHILDKILEKSRQDQTHIPSNLKERRPNRQSIRLNVLFEDRAHVWCEPTPCLRLFFNGPVFGSLEVRVGHKNRREMTRTPTT